MRQKYNKLLLGDKKENIKRPRKLEPQDIELINLVIDTMKKTINEMKTASRGEKRVSAKTVIEESKKLEDYPLSVEQAEKFNALMESEELEGIGIRSTDPLEHYLNKRKKMAIEKLAEAIDLKHYQIEDLDELKALARKITTKMEKEEPINVGAVKRKVENKISKVQYERTMQKIKYDIPTSIKPVIEDLVNGTIDIEKANEIMDEEAERMVESKTKTRFTLTQEQERKQIQIQIRTVVIEQAEKYRIKNPEDAVLQIKELCGGDTDQAVRTVVENLINRQDFDTAKSVCNKFSVRDKNGQIQRNMWNLKNRIRSAQISDFVLKGINMNGTEAEENAYFSLMEKGLKRNNIKLETISLGKRKNGVGNISLADIWPGEDQQGIAR